MNQDQFVARRQAQWQELTSTLAQMEKQGARRMPLAQVQHLGQLYRQTAADLAYARTYFPGTATMSYLNQLVSQAHSAIYREEPHRLRAIWRFFATEVPQTIRRHWRTVALAAAMTAVGTLIGFVAILHDPNLADAVVPDQVRNVVAQAKTGEIFPAEWRSTIGSVIMLNNMFVGIKAFGFGFTLGIGTAITLFSNGVMLGALAAHYQRASLTWPFWALILPHGVLEFMAIFLCGAAGLELGWSIIAPGDLPRTESIAQGGRKAVKLLIASLPFFVVAAIIEGFVTPMTSLSNSGKYLVGAATGIIGLAYWLLPGRSKTTAAPAP
jgi:uncharacterized membrane protein SpoIIM required for sporulation